MKKKKITALALSACLLTGCGAAAIPETQPETTESVRETVSQAESFLSQDGTMEFTLALEPRLEQPKLAVLSVTPRYLTGQEVRQVAEALLGPGDFYEAEPSEGGSYSQEEYRRAIAITEAYTTREAMETLGGDPEEMADWIPGIVTCLEHLQEAEKTAPGENPHSPCAWEFHDFNHYRNSQWDADLEDQVILATAQRENAFYQIDCFQRQEGQRISVLSVTRATPLVPRNLDQMLLRQALCRREPTEAEMAAAAEQAQELLEKMNLGSWVLDRVETVWQEPDHGIHVEFGPELQGMAGMSRLSWAKEPGQEDGYRTASCIFTFAPGGELLDFELSSPVGEIQILEESPEILPYETLLDLGKQALSQMGSYSGLGAWEAHVRHMEQEAGEQLHGRVTVTGARLALGRCTVAPDTYHYIPVLMLEGITEYYGAETGNFCFDSSFSGYPKTALVAINALDGSIIG